ncbi:MAG: hypothetical protein R3A78_09880 [Polyangiales bacterium]|nr:hypothetical protein [Myxococcales bacterium]
MERDLQGRCGTCGFYVRLRTDDQGVSEGECRLGCWPPPLRDTATCSSHKPIGASWDGALKRKKVAGAPRHYADHADDEPVRKSLPQEIGIDMDQSEFRDVLRQILREELGVSDIRMGERWRGGELVLKPGKSDTQDKHIPLDTFFHKIVMIRDKLRVLEQKINGNAQLSDQDKVQLQQYVTGCYGTLTTFNVLFRDREDGFSGASGKD